MFFLPGTNLYKLIYWEEFWHFPGNLQWCLVKTAKFCCRRKLKKTHENSFWTHPNMISLKKNLNRNVMTVIFYSLQEPHLVYWLYSLILRLLFVWLWFFFPTGKKNNTVRLIFLVKLPRLGIYHTILPGDCFASSNFTLKSTKSGKIYQRIKKHKCWVSLFCPSPHNQTQASKSGPKEKPRALSLHAMNQRSLSFALWKM